MSTSPSGLWWYVDERGETGPYTDAEKNDIGDGDGWAWKPIRMVGPHHASIP